MTAPAATAVRPARGTAGVAHPVPLALTLAAVVSWGIGLTLVDRSAMTDAGLISVLGPLVLLGYVLLAGAIATALHQPVVPQRLLALQAVVLVVMVHGLPSLLEPHAPYFTAYLHVGFVEEIARTGRTVPRLDARFAWPGSFSLAALISDVGGVRSAQFFLRWAPVLFNLAYLAPLRLLARTMIRDERGRWLAVLLFPVANWVHQDYFSPQALNFFVYLAVLVVVLRWFGAGDAADGISGRRGLGLAQLAGVDRLLRRWSAADQQRGEQVAPEPAQARLLVLVLVVALASMAASHQLTPINALLVVGALVAVRRCSLQNLPWVLALLIGGWFAVGATGFWTGHLGVLTSGAGEVSQNVGRSLGGRVGGSEGRSHILTLRLALTVVLLVGAAAGGIRQWLRGAPPLAMAACIGPPFLLVVGQSYGGEVLLRSYLFALPGLCVLVAGLVIAVPTAHAVADGTPVAAIGIGDARDGARQLAQGGERGATVAGSGHGGAEDPHRRPGWPWLGAVAVGLAVLSIAGVTARYGNERFEQVAGSDLAAVRWTYAHAPLGSTLVAADRNLPWRYQDIERYAYVPTGDEVLSTPKQFEDVLAEQGGDGAVTYFIASDGQDLFGAELSGLPRGWLRTLEHELVARGRLRLAFSTATARVYRVIGRPGGGS